MSASFQPLFPLNNVSTLESEGSVEERKVWMYEVQGSNYDDIQEYPFYHQLSILNASQLSFYPITNFSKWKTELQLSLLSRKPELGKYFAFKTLATKEFGWRRIGWNCWTKRAWLKAIRSWKPTPLFGWQRDLHWSHWIPLDEEGWLHQ